MKLYIVIDIGCIECKEESEVVGIFTDREQALATNPQPPWRVMFETNLPTQED